MVLAIDLPVETPHSGQAEIRSGYEHPVPAEMFNRYIVFGGSGGVARDFGSIGTASIIYLPVPTPSPLVSALSAIEQAFGLTKHQLAGVLKTTRKTIYNWIDGSSKPNKTNLGRIFDLVVVANDWAEAGFSKNNSLLAFKVIEERSVLDLLSQDQFDRELILLAGSRLQLQGSESLADPFA
ncbi:MAG: hypothetical protein RJQ07_07980 [Pseudomonadales bacterium]